jgi:hypothetical protein
LQDHFTTLTASAAILVVRFPSQVAINSLCLSATWNAIKIVFNIQFPEIESYQTILTAYNKNPHSFS